VNNDGLSKKHSWGKERFRTRLGLGEGGETFIFADEPKDVDTTTRTSGARPWGGERAAGWGKRAESELKKSQGLGQLSRGKA